mgnify:CR=1 FL=1
MEANDFLTYFDQLGVVSVARIGLCNVDGSILVVESSAVWLARIAVLGVRLEVFRTCGDSRSATRRGLSKTC